MPPKRKVAPPRKNPISNIKPILTPLARATARLQEANRLEALKAKPRKRGCTNKNCDKPKIEDGICTNCGTMVEESSIQNEITFGESSSGAAVVQGSFVQEGQSGARSMGPRGMNSSGSEGREKTEREAKRIMTGLATEHSVNENLINRGMTLFRMAQARNFTQGRTIKAVAACCLYSTCRNQHPCKVMLLDFADSIQMNVFKLGHCYKALNKIVTMGADDPILPEDLIYRFAQKLEFNLETEKVAETAVRLVNRMKMDWMVSGRRPNGICGACLVLAARMHNFRRTTTEVVYVVKVTTATIQKRLTEFAETATSQMTVEDYLGSEFLESSHDPPAFYQATEAWKKAQQSRKRKLKPKQVAAGEDNGAVIDQVSEGADAPPSGSSQGAAVLTSQQSTADSNSMPPPPRPSQIEADTARREREARVIDPALLEDTENDQALASLINQHGDVPNPISAPSIADASVTLGKRKRGRPSKNADVNAAQLTPPSSTEVIDPEWEADEASLEAEISEMINDPYTLEHANAFATAEQRARIISMTAIAADAALSNGRTTASSSTTISADEFADDPEVKWCLLTEAETKIKEQIWINANRDWLKQQQAKEYREKVAAAGPPKAKRNRVKKARIGEFQTEAAQSPADAAVNAMKERAFSTRINYSAIEGIFKDKDALIGSGMNSRATSRAGSAAPSSIFDRVTASTAGSVTGADTRDGQSVTGDDGDDGTIMEDDDEPFEDEIIEEGEGADDDWRRALQDDEEEEANY